MKIAFLDRDGVINEFPGNGKYVTKVKDFHIIPGSLEAIRKLTEAGVTIFVVSNQAGVGKGIYSKNKLSRITRRMIEEVEKTGGKIKKVYYCTHRSDEGCTCRKPGIDSIKKALKSVNKTLRFAKNAFFVGDTVTDIVAGKKAGCKTVFVLSGRSNRMRLRQKGVAPDYIAENLLKATKIILNGHDKRKASKR